MGIKKGEKSMFWGIIFVVIGVIILLNIGFGLNLPVMRTLFGVLLIYWGVKVIMGPSFKNVSFEFQSKESVVFDSAKFKPKDHSNLQSDYNIIFSEGVIDLSDIKFSANNTRIEINTIFGHSKVIIPADVTLETRINSVAGSVKLPKEKDATPGAHTIKLIINTIFGATEIERTTAPEV